MIESALYAAFVATFIWLECLDAPGLRALVVRVRRGRGATGEAT